MGAKSGFSLVEVTVAGVIFMIAVAGVFASLAAVKKTPVPLEMGAAYCGQQLLENLRVHVDAREWDAVNGVYNPNTLLATGPHKATSGNTADAPFLASLAACVGYTVQYTVENVPGKAVKKVKTDITW